MVHYSAHKTLQLSLNLVLRGFQLIHVTNICWHP